MLHKGHYNSVGGFPVEFGYIQCQVAPLQDEEFSRIYYISIIHDGDWGEFA